MTSTHSLTQYFKSINDLNPLTKEEEFELATKSRNGDTKAMEKMINHNLKIVVMIANRNKNRGIPVEDLIQQGNLGLYEAALRYNPESSDGARFASYAGLRVLKKMNELIDSCGRPVRIPVNQEYKRYMSIKNGESVDNIEPVRIDEFISEDSEGKTKGDYILKENPTVEVEFQHDYCKVVVTKAVGNLKPIEQKVVQYYFGLGNKEILKSGKIAKRLGISPVKVSQIISKVKKNLRSEIGDKVKDEIFIHDRKNLLSSK